MNGHLEPVLFLIRDRDAKFTRSFDDVLRSQRERGPIKTPIRSKATPSPSASSARSDPSCWTSSSCAG